MLRTTSGEDVGLDSTTYGFHHNKPWLPLLPAAGAGPDAWVLLPARLLPAGGAACTLRASVSPAAVWGGRRRYGLLCGEGVTRVTLQMSPSPADPLGSPRIPFTRGGDG